MRDWNENDLPIGQTEDEEQSSGPQKKNEKKEGGRVASSVCRQLLKSPSPALSTQLQHGHD